MIKKSMKKVKFRRNSTFSLKKPLFDAFLYIKESKGYVLFIACVFFLSAILGFFYTDKLSFFDEILRRIIAETQDLSGIELIIFIFTTNATSAVLGLFLGLFLGVFPLINGITNGAVLGYVLGKSYQISALSNFWKILPHGIFELPAIFLALGLGIKLGMSIFSQNIKKTLLQRLYYSFITFILVIIPLLIIAAMIEGLLITIVK